jgi:lysophospholipase L1-like esterase
VLLRRMGWDWSMAHKILHIHDGLLGYVPRPGMRGNVQNGAPITIDVDGFRYTGDSHLSTDGVIAAVGDSYTFGEDVGDKEAWPAQLQGLTGRRVLNAGVSGYGFDQIVLRVERLAEASKPSVVIVSFIADDIYRTEMRRLWWHDKPWFEIEKGHLVLKGVPVPNHTRLPLKARVQVESVLVRLPPILQHLAGYHARIHGRGHGGTIALRLTERLARLQVEHEVRIVMIAQYDSRAWISKENADEQRGLAHAILSCAAANGLATLDTYERFAAEPARRELYGSVHLNARGNRVIARLLAATLPALLSRSIR